MPLCTFEATTGIQRLGSLEWMTGDVHHKAKAQDIIELTSLPTPGEFYEPGCQRNRDELQSIF